jgi:HipA-like protein
MTTMKQFLRTAFRALMGHEGDEWEGAAERSAPGVRVLVELDRPGGKPLTVGQLWFENGQYVFRYSPEFAAQRDATPIPGFPDLGQEYRDAELFPFFRVRLPPRQRKDVQQAMSRMSIPADDMLRVLGQIAKKTISSPYEFELLESA